MSPTTQTPTSTAPRLAVFAFAASVAVSAALLFVVQPMLGKALLPAFGGGAAIWTAVMLFFQVGLLAGSALFHATTTRLGPVPAAAVHFALAVVGLLVLPRMPQPVATGLGPAIDVLATLAAGYGPIVLVLGANAAALQTWYARALGRPPWWLYAVSNAGSFVGLIAYPLVIESALSLPDQGVLWLQAFAVCVLGLASCAWLGLRRPAAGAERAAAPAGGFHPAWIFLAALPSSLLLGVTEHVTVTVAPTPMLWVLPLAVYLATWIGAFWRPAMAERGGRLVLMAACPLLLLEFQHPVVSGAMPAAGVALHVAGLGGAGLLAHGMLALRRPPAAGLTGFYLHVSLGGAIGGVLNAILAPLLLDRALEYQFAVAVLLLLLALGRGRGAWLLWGAMAGLVAFASLVVPLRGQRAVGHARDFYGTVGVVDTPDQRHMLHGRTVHGVQWLDPARRLEPASYYHRDGGVARLIATMLALRAPGAAPMEAVFVGLGAGTLACFGSDRLRAAFVEISPAVIAAARRWFAFLAGCGEPPVELGDGRLRLAARAPGSLDLIVLDAYSGVSIPVHMATAEATALFLDRLAPGGVLAVHVSSSHFNLAPLVSAAARDAGAAALVLDVTAEGVSATWMALTRDAALAAHLTAEGWAAVPPAPRAWQDDRWDLMSAIRR